MNYKVNITEIIPNRLFLFQSLGLAANQEALRDYVSHVQAYLQTHYPYKQYNLFVERNMDVYSVVAVLDINELPTTETGVEL